LTLTLILLALLSLLALTLALAALTLTLTAALLALAALALLAALLTLLVAALLALLVGTIRFVSHRKSPVLDCGEPPTKNTPCWELVPNKKAAHLWFCREILLRRAGAKPAPIRSLGTVPPLP